MHQNHSLQLIEVTFAINRTRWLGHFLILSLSLLTAHFAHAAVLVRQNFNGTTPWNARTTSGTQTGVVTVSSAILNEGTYDTQDSSPTDGTVGTASKALVLSTSFPGTPDNWTAEVASEPITLAVANNVTNLAKLTLSFDLKPSAGFPVEVVITSVDASNNPTGSRSTRITPRAIGSMYRYSIDLDQATPLSGTFSATAPKIRVAFRYGSALGWPSTGAHTLAVDNISYTSPKYYVNSTTGINQTTNSYGLSEEKPFRTIQYAVDRVAAGDVICVMSGTYEATNQRTVIFDTAAAPDAWIVLRACPGIPTVPVIRGKYWDVITIDRPSAYIEIRDLEIKGYRPAAGAAFDAELALAEANVFSTPEARFNTTGISVNGRTSGLPDEPSAAQLLAAQLVGVHHVRVINNRIYDLPGSGVAGLNCDYLTVEGNIVYGNAFFSRYGMSGLTTLHSWNFDQYTGYKNFFVANTTYDNRTYASCISTSTDTPTGRRLSDGNGIIIDTNSNGQYVKDSIYGTTGRTLVAGNVAYGNGGAGIAITSSWKTDIINNTLYQNVQTPDFIDGNFTKTPPIYPWFEIQIVAARGEDRSSDDIHIRNNVIIPASYKNLVSSGNNTTNISFFDNLYYSATGTYTAPVNRDATSVASTPPVGAGNIKAPAGSVILKAPSLEFSGNPDFRPAAGSLAIDMGSFVSPSVVRWDRNGSVRPSGSAIDAGAFEYPATPPAPSGVVTQAGNELTWPHDPSIVFYSVYRSTNVNGPYTKISTTELTDGSYLDTTAAPETAYFYKLSASNLSDESAPGSATQLEPLITRAIATFTGGAGTANPQQYPGTAGDGWLNSWGISGTGTGLVSSTTPLNANGNYLTVSRSGGTSGQEGIHRQWSGLVQPWDAFTRIQFDFRLDSTTTVFNSSADNVSINARSNPGAATGGDSTFFIRAYGAATGPLQAREWGVFNGDPGVANAFDVTRFLPTGMICQPGVTYTFTVDVYGASGPGTTEGHVHGTYDVTISDGTQTVKVSGAGFRTAEYGCGGHFAIATQQSATTDNLAFSIDSITIDATPPNEPPTISAIAAQTINEDAATAALGFTVGDQETAAANLAVTATSSNPALVPESGIVITGTGANRTISATPALNQSGTATITLTVMDAAATSTSTSFLLTVNAVNDLPSISAIPAQTINEDSNTGAVPFTVSDVETAATSLTVTRASSNLALVPLANVVLGGTGANRTVTLTPAANQSGTATITLTVTDGGAATATSAFVVTVNAINDLPTISTIAAQTIDEDTATAALPFTVNDIETPAANLTLTRASSNLALVPLANVVLGGTGANRTVTVTPAANQSGTATITLTVTDGGTATATSAFVVTVSAINDLPTISSIAAQTIDEDTVTASLPFTVNDIETPAANLTVTRASSNLALVPLANVVLGGTGANRTVTLTPAANQSGTATITLTVTDGGAATATSAFVITVNAINDLPTISAIAAQTIDEDTATGTLAVTVGDIETAAASLTLARASSNLTLVPLANVVLGGTGANRTVTVTPAANQSGTATITLTVTDGGAATATSAFVVTVNAINDLPTISAIAAQTIDEDTVTASLPFTVNDIETPAANLTVTRASSNLTLVPLANVVLGGTGANRTVTVTPAANQSGTATITLTVTDGGAATATSAFVITVNAINDLPTISAIAAQTIDEDTVTAALPFTLNDIETPAANLTVTRASSNLALVPLANVVLGGTGANRTVTVTPAANQSGTATITLTVTDGGAATATSAFLVTVNAINDLPTITTIAAQTIAENGNTGPLSFDVSDIETPASALLVLAESSDAQLLPASGIAVIGTGVTRTIQVTPAPYRSGSASIRLTVTDEQGASSLSTFTLNVTPAPVTNVSAHFRDGSGTSTSEQFPGIAGSGWLGSWVASSAVLPTVATATPLRDGAAYLHVARTGGTSGQEGVSRQWSNAIRPTSQFTRLTFDVRLDSPVAVFNAAADNLSITTRSGAGPSTGNDSSVFIRVYGGPTGPLRTREWAVFNGDPGVVNNFDVNRFIPTGMICEPGVTYTFTVDIYAAPAAGNTDGRIHGTYDVTIADGTNSVQIKGAGFRTASYQSGGNLAVCTQQSLATDNLSFSLDTIVLDGLQPEPLPAMARWRSGWVPPAVLANPTLEDSHWGDLADYDADGSSNLLEYAVGSNPAEGASAWLPVAGADPSGRLTLSFPRVADPNLLYEVLGSSDLGGWTTIWSSTGAANVAGTVLVTDTAPLGQSSRFLRLRVTTP